MIITHMPLKVAIVVGVVIALIIATLYVLFKH